MSGIGVSTPSVSRLIVRIGPVDLAVAAAFAVLLYYLALDARLGAFILGWVFLRVGHRFEENKPELIFPELFDSLTFSG
jgi:uncharacterized membrane protein YGL010W